MNDIPADMPVYAYIKRELKNQIESGELPEGARVPSEFELARMYGVSRNPTRQALRDLELEGYVTRAPGRGSFVAPIQQHQRVLQMNGLQTVAIACPEMESRYTRSVVKGFVSRASEHKYHPMVYFLRFSNQAEFDFLADIRNSGIGGIAFWLQHATERTLNLLQKFKKASFPFVLIDRYVRGLDADFVVTDNIDTAYQLTKGLIGRGHSQIGYISTPLDNTTAEDRFTGYRRALKEADIPYSEELLGLIDDVDSEPIFSVVSRIMAHRRRPSAYVCVNDGAAEKLIDTLSELDYTVPGDVELAAVDDNELAEALGVPMLRMSQAGEAMGAKSAEILLERIARHDLPPQHHFLKADFHPCEDAVAGNEPEAAAAMKGGVAAK
jgi:GntR family transcriptional regulator, arabinose operon transcriptional repressor